MNLNFKKPFIIAEIGNNHEGNLNNAIKLIDKSKDAGADAVKFQTYKIENYINKSQIERYKRLKKFQLSYSDFHQLQKYTHKKNMKFISTPLDLESSNFLKKICDVLKIASGDNNYFQLIKNVFQSTKPIILSTGMADMNELKKTLKYIIKIKNKNFLNNKFSLLHCVASYPTELNDANVSTINILKKNFGFQVGLSDHCRSNMPAIVSLGMGVKIFEKHITLSNSFSKFIDHKVALNPKDFKIYVQHIHKAFSAIGKFRSRIFECEKNTIINNRRSLYAKEIIYKGQKINYQNTIALRPYEKKSPNIIKKKLIAKKNYKINEAI